MSGTGKSETAGGEPAAGFGANLRGRGLFAANCLNFTRCAESRKGEKQQPAAQFGTFNGPDGVAWSM